MGCGSSRTSTDKDAVSEESPKEASLREMPKDVIARARDSSVEIIRRLSMEYTRISEAQKRFSVEIVDDNMTHWTSIIEGPTGSPYESGRFVLDLVFPSKYPFEPPKVTFRTPVFHPNVSTSGAICMDILKPNGAWSPLMTVESLLVSIQSLLDDPNPSDPLNSEAADLYVNNRRMYEVTARRETSIHAHGLPRREKGREDPFAYLQESSGGQVISEDDAFELAVHYSKRKQ